MIKSEGNLHASMPEDAPETTRVKRRRRDASAVAAAAAAAVLPCDDPKQEAGAAMAAPTTVKRSSKFRGVSRHRWTGRYEAHLWDKLSWNITQKKKGKQGLLAILLQSCSNSQFLTLFNMYRNEEI